MQELSLINKEIFISAIKTLQEMHNEENKIMETFRIEPEWVCGEWIYNYFKLIQKIIKPYDESDWLGYFCYELNFGERWKPGTITEEDGTDIKLQTPEDLYELLKINFAALVENDRKEN